jgi:hypothetical protein
MQIYPDIAPLFFCRRLKSCIKGGDVSKYCVRGYLYSKTYMSAKRLWRYIGVWLHIPLSVRNQRI